MSKYLLMTKDQEDLVEMVHDFMKIGRAHV